MRVVVSGAGAFGSWVALWLLRRGASVTLLEQYGPGNSLPSSGDESRELAPDLFVPTGVLWLAHKLDGFEAHSADTLSGPGIPHERVDAVALRAHSAHSRRRHADRRVRAGRDSAKDHSREWRKHLTASAPPSHSFSV